MSSNSLYELLPEVYRGRDADKDHPLRALLELVADDAGDLERDVAALYESWFIDTSSDWVLVYVGDLLGRAPRATRFAVTPLIDKDGKLSDFALHAQTYRLHRVCWETSEDGHPANARVRRIEVEYATHGAIADRLTYLDVWKRVVTPIEDYHTSQAASGGPDTGARIQLVQELRLRELGSFSTAAYRGLENLLHRVEVHDVIAGIDLHGFTWSRDNGAIVAVLSALPAKCSTNTKA